ncbi:c-type cytochrome [Aliiroseovarius sp. KMU-50]|uniref:C-type cytochrome n=1 Tax=Aliiroseovarius salicola TaxID=3009082 RepID=A0ABT4W5J4_9RHOB|nr:c-type cytochrome [Aliiroseovarius sp. KMU-50]MDA5095789.1 c-type cytochrome [Aliiroseovarius sp. KMU-50]
MITNTLVAMVLTTSIGLLPSYAFSDSGQHTQMTGIMAEGLEMPMMDAESGRLLFASKGCVVCHSINGIGGEHAPMLDASTMDEVMNPFEFAARMWRGAEAMVELQEDELGAQIELSGQELADIIAFVHDAREQEKFTQADIPKSIEVMMHHQREEDHHAEGEGDHHN